jgi:hypothetical protein
MRQISFKHSLCFLFSLFILSQNSYAQKPQPAAKIKPPKMTVSWGNSKGGSLSPDAFVALLDSAIRVVSEKKELLAISSGMLVYKSKVQVEDEKGKV